MAARSRASSASVTGAAEELGRLAAQLGRPPASLSAFRALSAEQLSLLSGAIDDTRARRRRDLEAALARPLPSPARRAILALLRVRGG